MNALAAAATITHWIFGAYLSDDRIGEHRYELTERDGEIQLVADASFRVTVLRIPVFTYKHHVAERWRAGCLVEIRSQTRSGRTEWDVSGHIVDDTLEIEIHRDDEERHASLDGCVASFAYWSADVLANRTQLLNGQTGEYESVTVTRTPATGDDPLTLTLEGGPFRIDVFYRASDSRWVGLDTTTEDDRRLVYRLESSGPGALVQSGSR